MTLIEYDFYVAEYCGSVVDESSFKTVERRAENILNRLTFNRLIFVNNELGQMIGREFEAFTDSECEMLKCGLCALMDVMSKLDKAQQQSLAGNNDSGNVKSRSSGGESVSYERQKTVYDEALQDESKKNTLFRSTLMEYIQPGAFRHNPFYAGSW